MSASLFVYKNGSRLAVLRPTSEEEAKRSMSEALRIKKEADAGTLSPEEVERQFNEIIQGRQFVFVGFLGKRKGTLLDKRGKTIGETKAGDSFVLESDLKKFEIHSQPN